MSVCLIRSKCSMNFATSVFESRQKIKKQFAFGENISQKSHIKIHPIKILYYIHASNHQT